MSPLHRRLTTFGAAVVLACTASPAAFGADLRSPDTRDLAAGAPASAAVDLRAPDRLAPGPAIAAVIDGRTPDSVDRAARPSATPAPVVSVGPSRDGFDWGAAGIGAGGMVAVLLFGLGATLLATHRRRGVKAPRAVAH